MTGVDVLTVLNCCRQPGSVSALIPLYILTEADPVIVIRRLLVSKTPCLVTYTSLVVGRVKSLDVFDHPVFRLRGLAEGNSQLLYISSFPPDAADVTSLI